MIVLDGTPSGSTPEEEALLTSQGLLLFPSEKYRSKRAESAEDGKKKLTELEALLKISTKGIKSSRMVSSKGALNVILGGVNDSHLAVIERALNASRYAGF